MRSLEPLLALTTGLASLQGEAPTRPQTRLQYSAVTNTETRLPEGVRPASLLQNRTGSFLVGDFVFSKRSEIERLVEGSHELIQRVASQLPIDEADERIVDALFAKQAEHRKTRPLQRRIKSSR